MKKLIYIASPFFTQTQLVTIEMVEKMTNDVGLAFYSPRVDGILKNMTPEQRKANANKIFKLNCSHMIHANASLCILDDKDQGTNWENGFAYYHRRYYSPRYRLYAYTSDNKELNVMLQQSFDYHAKGPELALSCRFNLFSDRNTK